MDTVTPKFDGGALNSKGATATGTNVTLGTSDTSGISVLAKGTAGRDAVLYNGAVAGYVSVADNTTASAAVASSTWNGTTYYITALTLPKDKKLSVTTSADTALDTTSDLTISNAAYRRVNLTNAANGTVLVGNSGNTTVTSGSKTAGNLTVAAYDTSSASATTSKTIVSNGVWSTTAASGTGTYYGRVTVAAGSATTPATTITANPTLSTTFTSGSGY